MYTKTCSKCGNEFPTTLEYFHKQIDKKDGLTSACKKCRNKDKREYYKNNRSKILSYYRKRNYGISQDEYDELLKKQKNRCATCGLHIKNFNENLSVDHDHKTGKIRGLLCRNCNRFLGFVNDNRILLIKFAKYLGE